MLGRIAEDARVRADFFVQAGVAAAGRLEGQHVPDGVPVANVTRVRATEGCAGLVPRLFAGKPDGVIADGVGDHTAAVIDRQNQPSVCAHPARCEVWDAANNEVPVLEYQAVAVGVEPTDGVVRTCWRVRHRRPFRP